MSYVMNIYRSVNGLNGTEAYHSVIASFGSLRVRNVLSFLFLFGKS